jgi:chaperonin GroES
MHKERESFMPL